MTAEIISESLISTLPGNTYVDEDIFRKEQERIFEQMWFCAVRSEDLAKPGAYKTVQIGRESVIVTRNRKGAIRAYYNICRHRGVEPVILGPFLAKVDKAYGALPAQRPSP